MKLIYAFLIIILSVVVQTGFIRLFDLFSLAPVLPIIALFILCYFLLFEKILVLSIFTGLAMDLASSVSFGSTIVAAFGACSLSFYLREKILIGGRFSDQLLNVLASFSVFYFLLGSADIFFSPSADYQEIFNLINLNLAGEIILDAVLWFLGYYLAGYFNSNKIYGFIQNIKISA